MDKKLPSFAEDLRAIQGEVEADVGTILELAKHRRMPEASVPQPTEEEFQPKQAGRRSIRPRGGQRPKAADEPQPQLLQNVTTRLSHATNMLLTEAALRQRLNKALPATRQDIIEEAVRDWLQQHGYLKPS
jgi:hypothetical protein